MSRQSSLLLATMFLACSELEPTNDTPAGDLGWADISAFDIQYNETGPDGVYPCGEPCVEPMPICDTANYRCVQCLDDSNCKEGICYQNICRSDLVCVPGSIKCHKNEVHECSEDGKSLLSVTPCEEKVCYEGQCLTCKPGSADCETANMARLCRLDGSGWDYTDCKDLKCVSGICAFCIPGFKRCEGTKVYQCQADAASFVEVEDCDTNNTGKKCHLGMCIQMCELNAKFHTNQGCEYWAIDMDNYHDTDPSRDGQNSPYALVVSNTDPEYRALVTIYQWDGQVKQIEAPPMTATPIFLPPYNIEGGQKAKRVWRLSSTLPIVAYQFNPLENVGVYSNDASLLLPTNVLGKRYMVLSWPTLPGVNEAGQLLASNFAVVGVEPKKTKVKIKVTARTLSGPGVPEIPKGGTYETELDQFEVLNLEAADYFGDLTGSTIEADGRVAVFAGHVCAFVPLSRCKSGKCSYDPTEPCVTDTDCPFIMACDHMEEQLQPLSAWSDNYVVGRLWPRGNAPDIVRVLAAEDNTHVTVVGANIVIPVLNSGMYHEFEITNNIEVHADKPILVGQFMEGQDAPGSAHNGCYDMLGSPCDPKNPFGCECYDDTGFPIGKSCVDDTACSPGDANIGDPSFIVGVPTKQFRKEYVFLVPIKYKSNYVNITAEPGSTVILDGKTVAASEFKPISGGSWAVARLPLEAGSHTLSSDKNVGIVVYGWDRYVSYGYPGGMNVETLKVFQ